MSVRVPSVAVNVYDPAVSRIVELKVATPPEAVAESLRAMLPGPVAMLRLIVSVLPVFEPVSTLPLASSTQTVNELRADPAVPVVGGSALKTTLVASRRDHRCGR